MEVTKNNNDKWQTTDKTNETIKSCRSFNKPVGIRGTWSRPHTFGEGNGPIFGNNLRKYGNTQPGTLKHLLQLCLKFLGHSLLTCLSTAFQRFSITFRSGLCAGQWRTLIHFLLNHCVTDSALCLGSLLCWNMYWRLRDLAKGSIWLWTMSQYTLVHCTMYAVQRSRSLRVETAPGHDRSTATFDCSAQASR